MATALVVSQIVQLRVFTKLDAQLAINSLYMQVVSLTGTIFCADLALNFKTSLLTDWPPIIATPCSFRGVGCQQATGIKDAEAYAVAAVPGTGGATPLPKQVAGLISVYTGLAGRKNRGRMYIPFPDSSHNTTDGVPTAGYITLLNNVASDILTSRVVTNGGNTATFQPVIFHRLTGTATPVTTSIQRAVWATQKRRGDYGRTNVSPI